MANFLRNRLIAARTSIRQDLRVATSPSTWGKLSYRTIGQLFLTTLVMAGFATAISLVQFPQDVRQRAAGEVSGQEDGYCIVGYYTPHNYPLNNSAQGYITKDALSVGFTQAAAHIPADRKHLVFFNSPLQPGNLNTVDILFVDDFFAGFIGPKNAATSNLAWTPTPSEMQLIIDEWVDGMSVVVAGDNMPYHEGGIPESSAVMASILTSGYASETVYPSFGQVLYYNLVSEPKSAVTVSPIQQQVTPSPAIPYFPSFWIDTRSGLNTPGHIQIVQPQYGRCLATVPSVNPSIGNICIVATIFPNLENSGNGFVVVDANAGTAIKTNDNVKRLIQSLADCAPPEPTNTPTNTPVPTSTPTSTPPPTPTNTPPAPTATPTTPLGLTCNGVSVSYGLTGEPSRPPRVGEDIRLTCGNITSAERYEFRILRDNLVLANIAPSAAGSSISAPFTIPSAGNYRGQCRGCTGASAATCQGWE